MTAFYNEYEPKKSAWLRELIKKGVIAPGVVDERSIVDIRPEELTGYDQVHLCAGIGIWSYALRLAGWPDDKPVWTGSEPCQPHSAAGKMLGDADERYIRSAMHHAISHGKRPDVPYYFEQVANGDGLSWFDTLCADMEGANHTVRAFDFMLCGLRRTAYPAAAYGDGRRQQWTIFGVDLETGRTKWGHNS